MATPNALVVFARTPVIARVDSRLAQQAGGEFAATLRMAMASFVWQVVLKAQEEGIARAVLYCDSPYPGDDGRTWLPGAASYHTQSGVGQGVRLHNAFRDQFRAGYTRVCAIGTDCLALTPRLLSGAFETLADTEVVLGPATNGGIYLLGLRRLQRGLFDGIPWGTGTVFDAALKRAAELSLSSLVLPTQIDLDSADDAMHILGSPVGDFLPRTLQELLRHLAGVDLPKPNREPNARDAAA